MKSFILIDHEPWTLRRKQLFYDLFEKARIDLCVWDLSQWLYPGFSNPDELTDEPYLTRIYSYEQYKKALSPINPKNTVIIEEVFREWNNRLVYKELARRNIMSIKIELYGNTILRETFGHKIKYITSKDLWKTIHKKVETIIFKFYNLLYSINTPVETYSSSILNRTKPLNHPDYDNFKFKTHKKIFDGDYIVFCDEYFPYHTDNIYFLRYTKLPDGKKYQKTMKKYFDFLEAKYNMPVIIAAHPKSDYKEGTFGNRKIIKYQTDSLVYNACMVTMHLGNSISFSILGDKPIAFITTDDYNSMPNVERAFSTLANNTLHQIIYNIDHCDMKDIEFRRVESQYREDYIYSYLTSKITENKKNEYIIREYLFNL